MLEVMFSRWLRVSTRPEISCNSLELLVLNMSGIENTTK